MYYINKKKLLFHWSLNSYNSYILHMYSSKTKTCLLFHQRDYAHHIWNYYATIGQALAWIQTLPSLYFDITEMSLKYIPYYVCSIPAHGVDNWRLGREAGTFILWQPIPESKRRVNSNSYLVDYIGDSNARQSIWSAPAVRLSTDNWPRCWSSCLCWTTHGASTPLSSTANWRLTTDLKNLEQNNVKLLINNHCNCTVTTIDLWQIFSMLIAQCTACQKNLCTSSTAWR